MIVKHIPLKGPAARNVVMHSCTLTPIEHLIIHHWHTCTTNTTCVFFIQCCACANIGETDGDRFWERLRSTSANNDLPVGHHFVISLLGHSSNDMLVSVILTGFCNDTERKQAEARLILTYGTLHLR